MKSLNIGIFGNNQELMQKIANAFGKKGTQSDITLYDHKSSDSIIVTILPHAYPEKIQTLLYTIDLCDIPVIVADKIDPVLGETIIALDLAGFKQGVIFLKESYLEDDIKKIISQTNLKDFEIYSFSDDASINELRIKTFGMDFIRENKGIPYVSVDHSFGVKGVGTVVLGFLKNNQLKVYDKLKVFPGKKETTVKSIQKHDENFPTAEPGDRVGLSLKDVTVDDVSRGVILSNSAAETKNAKLKMRISKFYKEPIKAEDVFFLAAGMQFMPFKVVSTGDILEIAAEKSFAYVPGMKIFVINPNSKLRVVGVGEIESNRN